LLAGTDIRVRRAGAAYVLEAAPPARNRSRPTRSAPSRHRPPTPSPSPVPHETDNGTEIVITGSNIRGLRDGPSPVQVIDRAAIERDGYGTVAEAIAALPQNFGGTGTEDTVLTNTDSSTLNFAVGSSANLRGLGSDATLTLVNGRRLPGSGGKGDFADLSLIPLAAVERVEVLTDGASAVYGADAVGGVVNLILRQRLDGGETRLRIGGATQGGASDLQIAHVQGLNWATGSLIAAYEFQRRGHLAAEDRAFTRGADLRPRGGDDFRLFFSSPGTIISPSPVTGALEPRFAIPAGTDGTGLAPSDFTPGANLQTAYEGADLLPRQTRHNGYLLIRQEVANGIEASVQGRYGRRRFAYDSAPSVGVITVTAANPFFVSPDGAPSSLIAYWFGEDLGPIRNFGTVQAWSVSGGLAAELGRGWALDLYAGYAEEQVRQGNDNLVQSSFLAEAVGALPDNPATAFSAVRDGYFNPYGDGRANNAVVLDFIDDGYLRQSADSGLTSLDAKLDGPLFDLPGGSVRVAFGGSYRRETFGFFGEAFVAGLAPTPIPLVGGARSMLAAFGEIVVPVVGPVNRRVGIERLELTGAVRFEHYSDFGGTANPKIGIVWEPLSGLRLRASYGTSFRTPALREINQPVGISSSQLRDGQNINRAVIVLTGGNPDLEPERSNSLSAGIVATPPAMPGLRLEAGYFRIRFSNRIGTPVNDNRQLALRDPTLAPFITPISPGTDPADLARVVALSGQPGSTVSPLIPPELYTAIVDSRFVNTASLFVQGVDLILSQRFNLAGGRASVMLNTAFLFDYTRRATPLADGVERVDTVGNPPDLRLRASASWDRGPFGITIAANHIGAYRDDLSLVARRVSPWTTFDAQLRMRLSGWLSGTQLALSVQNLFDSDPPFVNRSTGQAYDSTNADPLGRFVALQIIRDW
jgi:outer membrane receptor protein involved in Fe transport